MIASNDLRTMFLNFFTERGHEPVESSKVVPEDDPTLLFTNAGMNQFKNIFLGKEKTDKKRAVSVQKCIRVSGKHNDLEEVGKDGRHHTFFEMLGNWSFGDYYKREAIEWAWEFVTKTVNLSEENLWVSVYKDDEQAYDIWRRNIGIDKKRIVKLGDIEKGDEENFWTMGEAGPCGPCSEILYDYSPGPERGFYQGDKSGEIVELWNLVFMEFNREADGTLKPLPRKHIDTGMGLERMLAILQGVSSNYETDLFVPLIRKMEELCGVSANTSEHIVSYRVIADHIRALAFTIADGAIPSNEGRGYVVRRILRRASRHGRLLGIDKPFLHRLIDTLVDMMKDPYHELESRRQTVADIIRNEEELFLRTLDRGLEEFNRTVDTLRKQGESVFPGAEAFILHDTYGFPLDLTQIMAEEKGLSIDRRGFEEAMALQRERARKSSRFQIQEKEQGWIRLREEGGTIFTGYERTTQPGMRLIRYRQDGRNVALVFDKTPFYAESGGQVGDSGYIEAEGEGIRIVVRDVQKAGDDSLHSGVIEQGEILDVDYTGSVDAVRRRKIMANHTATHLLHHALRKTLGSHVSQAGSLVADDRLRFDFHSYQALSDEELYTIEEIVNEAILDNREVHAYEDVPFEEARSKGAIALFGEKYGKRVRIIEIEGISRELCGGTHAGRTGDLGSFKIVKEMSISSGVRRIEAVTSIQSFELMRKNHEIVRQIAAMLHTPAEGVVEKIRAMHEKIHELEKQAKRERKRDIVGSLDIEKMSRRQGRYNLVFLRLDDIPQDEMREISDKVKSRMNMGVLLLASVSKEKRRTSFVLSATDDAVKSGIHAGKLLQATLRECGGRGGGTPGLGQGGGCTDEGIKKAVEKLKELLKR